jgi:hypothetical protein
MEFSPSAQGVIRSGMESAFAWENKDVYEAALSALDEHGVQYMLGGAMAVYFYTGWWRATHDLDIYTTKDQVDEAAQALEEAGFHDIGEQAPGDREWIYHAAKDEIIIDVIWRFANYIEYVSPDWFSRAPTGMFLDVETRFLPLEELIWIKSFVVNRHRCDWPDIMRIIKSRCEGIDWRRLLDLVGDAWLLMAGMTDVFDWQFPQSADCIPCWVRDEFARRRKQYVANPPDVDRQHLLDPWLNMRLDLQ